MKQYFGKYRAIVTDIDDPEERGRIRVQCPFVLGDSKSSWCEVCSPVAYEKGGDFCLPRLGDTVWIEFEEGNQNKPIWVGGWWSSRNTPLEDYSVSEDTRVIEFLKGRIEMTEDCIVIKAGGSEISISEEGVSIMGAESVSITGPSVNANGSTITLSGGTIHLN